MSKSNAIGDEPKFRPCAVRDPGGDEPRCGLLHAFGFKAWTHGAAVSVGGFTAGQESHAVGIVEFPDGRIEEVPVGRIAMVEECNDGLKDREKGPHLRAVCDVNEGGCSVIGC